MLTGRSTVLVNRDSFPATIGFDFRVLPGLNPNVTYSISSLFGPDLKPQHLGHFATRYVSPEEGIKARQVVVLEMIEAEDVDKDRIIIPNLPKDRTENIKEQNEEMKKKRIEEYEKNQAPATSQEHIEKDEL